MAKKLKIAMAMGGGVSLGTFSGAALTESLKLLLLYGTDACGEPYDGIELDAMSGSSAGAMSLSIMLRALMNYESVLPNLKHNGKQATKQSTIDKLKLLYTNLPQNEDKLEQLIALQVAQDLQEKIWVDELEIDKLVGEYSPEDPDGAFSLLERKLFLEIIKSSITNGVNEISKGTIQVLNPNRFLFACSLSNLSPIKAGDVMNRFNKTGKDLPLVKNLLDSVSSFTHKEIRIIDFIFDKNEIKNSDKQWIKFHFEDNILSTESKEETLISISTEKGNFHLNEKKSWNVLAASVLACGAFPIAFEPVFLKRYKREYRNSWPSQFDEIVEKSNNISKNNSFIDAQKKNKLDYKSFNFPYVDGGTFNNEPLKEAFKMANFMDYNDPKDENKDNNYDRMVLFVDPIVRESDPKFRMTAYSPITTSEKKGKVTYEKNAELGKALGLSTSLLNMLHQQGAVKEEHKVDEYVENVQLTKSLINYLLQSKISYGNQSNKVIKKSIEKIKSFLKQSIIPDGTRDVYEYLLHKKEEYCNHEVDEHVFPELDKIDNKDFKSFIIKLINIEEPNTLGSIESSFEINNIKKLFNLNNGNEAIQLQNELLQLFFICLSTIALDTDGKDDKAIRVAITPFSMANNSETIRLPGVDVAAFAGFASQESRKYSFEYGRLCAIETLRRTDFREYYQEIITWNKPSCTSSEKIEPFISKSQTEELKETTIQNIKDKNFYSNYTNYADEVSESLYYNIMKKISSLFSLGRVKILAGVVGGILAGSVGLISPKLLINTIKKRFRIKEKLKKGIVNRKLKPITIKILSDTNMQMKINHEDGSEIKIKPIKEKINSKTDLLYLELFIDDKYLQETKKLRLYSIPSLQRKFNNKDPNLELIAPINIKTNQVKEITFRKKKLGIFPWGEKSKITSGKLIDNDDSSKFLSLSYLDYHVNPSLNIDLIKDYKNPEIIFVENTEAVSLVLEG